MRIDFAAVERLIEHRLHSIEILNWALKLRSEWDGMPSIAVLIDGKLAFEGTLAAITNPMLDAGFVHARALLEFLGLCDRGGKLNQIDGRKNSTDVVVKDFQNSGGPLEMLTPDLVLSRYEGPRDEAEKAFLRIFHIANEGLAHTTSAFRQEADDYKYVEIACRGIPALMTSYFYTPRGMLPPNPAITSRPRATPRAG